MPIVAIDNLADNYAWLLIGAQQQAVLVDPGEAPPILAALQKHKVRLVGILATHHHADHVGGIEDVQKALPQPVPVWGSAYDIERGRIPYATPRTALADGQRMRVGDIEIEAIHTPGHTLGALCYFVAEHQAVFTGDTLFLYGCGRLFEGSAVQMWQSLQRVRSLPDATQICCGHAYTDKNLRFARRTLPGNADIAQAWQQWQSTKEADKPRTHSVAQQRRCNPFWLADEAATQQALQLEDAQQAFGALRARRDNFA